MTYYEVYCIRDIYEVWKWTNGGQHGERYKVFKTRMGVVNWARKQWVEVIWR